MPKMFSLIKNENKLDGLRSMKRRRDEPQSLEDYLQLPDDYEQRDSRPGKKRVRWADIEEQKDQDRCRALGFVVGQTNWDKITDPNHAEKALTRTKYI
uniref:YLP motif-containing protein 1 n=1 Tax=Strigamia maritima TaxID=126957 RepID=T1JK27_STRMM